MKITEIITETATAGSTSAGNIATVDAPHISPGKSRGKTSYIGNPWGGISEQKHLNSLKLNRKNTKMGLL